eukprot:TRINITY_DN13123_c0_g1_i1.p1 TRINITY_DN13123_c0_g1~~TRINITY_DN13123_c0_g1_i1.p1  ORF type:complete len:542 (+),score=70.45 TRINITY_DN13123_c0_g1_i1:26-1627(+)
MGVQDHISQLLDAALQAPSTLTLDQTQSSVEASSWAALWELFPPFLSLDALSQPPFSDTAKTATAAPPAFGRVATLLRLPSRILRTASSLPVPDVATPRISPWIQVRTAFVNELRGQCQQMTEGLSASIHDFLRESYSSIASTCQDAAILVLLRCKIPVWGFTELIARWIDQHRPLGFRKAAAMFPSELMARFPILTQSDPNAALPPAWALPALTPDQRDFYLLQLRHVLALQAPPHSEAGRAVPALVGLAIERVREEWLKLVRLRVSSDVELVSGEKLLGQGQAGQATDLGEFVAQLERECKMQAEAPTLHSIMLTFIEHSGQMTMEKWMEASRICRQILRLPPPLDLRAALANVSNYPYLDRDSHQRWQQIRRHGYQADTALYYLRKYTHKLMGYISQFLEPSSMWCVTLRSEPTILRQILHRVLQWLTTCCVHYQNIWMLARSVLLNLEWQRRRLAEIYVAMFREYCRHHQILFQLYFETCAPFPSEGTAAFFPVTVPIQAGEENADREQVHYNTTFERIYREHVVTSSR